MKFNPIGSTFKEGNVTLQVVEVKEPKCRGCWYNNKKNYGSSCCTHQHACTSGGRKDKKQVIFKIKN